MTRVQMDQLAAQAYRNLSVIVKDESSLRRAAKYLRKLAKEVNSDKAEMTQEEFFAKLDKAKEGKGDIMLPNEDLTAFLKRLGYDL
ncbi:MAG: hypothetical protein IKP91_00895 [Bacteroidaceae bacterium]|nr:hypothetical protein [Bacteroidaceae bacterium]